LADVLADVKPFNSSIEVRVTPDLFDLDATHLPSRRTLAESSFKILQATDWTCGVSFHASIREVANPAPQSEFASNAGGEKAITHALHLPGYPELARRCIRLAHASICYS
jgi:hypothetical protein